MSLNESDTCRVYVTPGLRDSGWETLPHSITEHILAAHAGSFKCIHIGIVFFYRNDSPWIAASGQHDIHLKPSNAPVTIHIRMDIHKHEMS
jgi:hypothetical protein